MTHGRTWDDMALPGVKLSELDGRAFDGFRRRCAQAERSPPEALPGRHPARQTPPGAKGGHAGGGHQRRRPPRLRQADLHGDPRVP